MSHGDLQHGRFQITMSTRKPTGDPGSNLGSLDGVPRITSKWLDEISPRTLRLMKVTTTAPNIGKIRYNDRWKKNPPYTSGTFVCMSLHDQSNHAIFMNYLSTGSGKRKNVVNSEEICWTRSTRIRENLSSNGSRPRCLWANTGEWLSECKVWLNMPTILSYWDSSG